MIEYETINDIAKDIENQNIIINNTDKIKTEDFINENDLVDYIIQNIDNFAKDILQDRIINYEKEKPIKKNKRFSPRGKRIDLYIVGEKNNYIIEFKNPKYKSECRNAIGQILDYGREFSDSKKEMIIITTYYDIDTAKTIKYYNLPIRYIYLSKRNVLEYMEVE